MSSRSADIRYSESELAPEISEIEKALFVGSIAAARPVHLCNHRITAVVSALRHPLPCRDKWPAGIKYLQIPIDDNLSEQIHPHFDVVSQFIDDETEEGGKVLVHCLVGVSRSVALVLAYLVSRRRLSLREAYYKVVARRPAARPNNNFFEQLIRYEKKLTRDQSVYMITPDPFAKPWLVLPNVVYEHLTSEDEAKRRRSRSRSEKSRTSSRLQSGIDLPAPRSAESSPTAYRRSGRSAGRYRTSSTGNRDRPSRFY